MKKSVYSLVLSDHVVAAADRMAAKQGMSRSSLINQILAKHLSCTTPEMHIRNIFDALEQMTQGGNFRIKAQPSDAMMSLLTSLSYKYNPTVRYAITLTPQSKQVIGILKITFRTQSIHLSNALEHFFDCFCQLEESVAPKGVKYNISPGKFSRLLVLPDDTHYSADDTARAISDYIHMFDRALNAYFHQFPDTKQGLLTIAKIYQHYLEHATLQI